MKAIKIGPTSTAEGAFEYMNRFGIILSNEIIIHQYNRAIPIRLENLKKLELKKIRKYRRNSLCILIAFSMFAITFLFRFPQLYVISLFGLGTVLIITGLFVREYAYRLLIFQHHDFVALNIDKDYKDEAKSIASRINKKIKIYKALTVA